MDLSQFQDKERFLMLALDHRTSFKKLFNTEDKKVLIDEKRKLIDSLKDQFSGVLLDPELGLPAYKDKSKPFLLCVEESGFKEENGERITELEYMVEQLKKWGASGVKLLLYFNPYLPNFQKQIETAKNFVDGAKTFNLSSFLEIVTYGSEEKAKLILDSVKLLLANSISPDVFKLEFPADSFNCRKITEMLGKTPWILLTEGDDFDVFKENLKVASQNGAKGFLAGRALWKEYPTLTGQEKEIFLQTTLKERFKRISNLIYTS